MCDCNKVNQTNQAKGDGVYHPAPLGDEFNAFRGKMAEPTFSSEKAAPASEVAHRIRVAIQGVPLDCAQFALNYVMQQVDEQRRRP